MKRVKVKINKPFGKYSAGATCTIEVDKKGTPLDPFWRSRFKDARSDGCVEVVKPTRPRKPTPETSKGDS